MTCYLSKRDLQHLLQKAMERQREDNARLLKNQPISPNLQPVDQILLDNLSEQLWRKWQKTLVGWPSTLIITTHPPLLPSSQHITLTELQQRLGADWRQLRIEQSQWFSDLPMTTSLQSQVQSLLAWLQQAIWKKITLTLQSWSSSSILRVVSNDSIDSIE